MTICKNGPITTDILSVFSNVPAFVDTFQFGEILNKTMDKLVISNVTRYIMCWIENTVVKLCTQK